MDKKVTIVGAGALGRGTIGSMFARKKWKVTLVDKDVELLDRLFMGARAFLYNRTFGKSACTYKPFTTHFISPVALSFSACLPAPDWGTLAQLEGKVVMLENDLSALALQNKQRLLGVADVLAVRINDTVHTEDPCGGAGMIYLDEEVRELVGEMDGVSYMERERLRTLWAVRFLTHNTGHAVLAFLAKEKGYTWMWEAAEDKELAVVAQKAMEESVLALSRDSYLQGKMGGVDKDLVEELAEPYTGGEIERYKRFRVDLVERVSRNPRKKLEAGERLMGPASAYKRVMGKWPEGLEMGIRAACRCVMEEEEYARKG